MNKRQMKTLMNIFPEAVNLKLRQSSESVKTDLLQIKFDARRYEKLRDLNVSEMSLSEFVELIVYKNLESVSKTINVGEENREKLNERILRLTEMKSKSEVTIENLKKENEKMRLEIENKTVDVSKLQKNLHEMSKYNSVLQGKLENIEKPSLLHETYQHLPERGESAFVRLSKPTQVNNKDEILNTLAEISSNQTNIQTSCQQMKQGQDVGFSKLVTITQVCIMVIYFWRVQEILSGCSPEAAGDAGEVLSSRAGQQD